jgi:toxin ParE1/3/4
VKRYLISANATADLDSIWDHIATRSSPDVASGLIRKVYEVFASIALSPRAGVNMPDLPPGDVRKFPMGNYLIYYRALPGKIHIARVLHGKRVQRRAFLKKP